MTQARPIQQNFSAGEISPLLHGRSDFQRYQSGLRTLKGFVPLPGGGFSRAPGTIFRGFTRGNLPARLVPFEFAEDDALQLELTAGKMRVWSYGALVTSGASFYEKDVPWSTIDEIERLSFEQAADVIYVASKQRPIQTLSREALADWSVADAEFETGPFLPGNLGRGKRVQCSGTEGTITVTMNYANLIPGDNVGALLRIEVADFENIPLWTHSTTVAVDDKMVYNDRIYKVKTGTNTGTNPPVHRSGTRLVDKTTGIKWTYVSESYGIVRLVSLSGDGFVWTAEVLDTIPQECVDSPSYRWAVGAWSPARGYPGALAIFDQRLFAAGSVLDPRTVWFSVVGDFEDFEFGTDAHLAGAYTFAAGPDNSLNRIRWLAEGVDGLYAGTLGEVRRVHPSDAAAAIGPTNIRAPIACAIGVGRAQPVVPWTYPVMIDKSGKRLFELRRDENGLGLPLEISMPSSHIAARGMKELAWQSAPTGTLWIARKGGQGGLAALVYLPAQEMLGWAQVPIAGGVVESICSTPAAEGGRDIITMVVKRTINGVEKYCIEELADTQPFLEGIAADHEVNHLYCALEMSSPIETSLFVVDHLAGETVYAWTEKGGFGPLTVTGGGTVILPEEVKHAVIGLFDDTHEAETLRAVTETQEGTSIGRKHRMHAGGGVILHRTAGGTVQVVSRDFTQAERTSSAKPLVPEVPLNWRRQAHSGVHRINTASGHAEEVSLRFRPEGGAPLTVLAATAPSEEAGV